MNKQFRISFLWLLIVIGYIFHSTYHLSEAVFGIDIKLPNATGEVPPVMYIIRIVLEIFTLTLVLVTLYSTGKIFSWFSFVWASILGVLNAFHLGQTLMGDAGDLSQVVLLTFILATNVLLVIETRKQTRLISAVNAV